MAGDIRGTRAAAAGAVHMTVAGDTQHGSTQRDALLRRLPCRLAWTSMKRIRNGTSRSTGRRLIEAHAQWRDAAQLVALRWEVFLQAGGDARGPAFASYLAALDAEEAAAAAMARLTQHIAA